MGTSGGPNIERDGLVFGYDTGYPAADNNQALRFYRGEPTVNLITNPLPTSVTGFNRSGGTGTISYDSAEKALKWVQTDYATWGTYLNIYPSFTGTLSTSTQYTLSFEYKTQNPFADSLIGHQLVQGNGQSAATSNSNITSDTYGEVNGWKQYRVTFTPGNSGVGSAYNRLYAGDRGSDTLTMYIRNIQFENKSHQTPFVSGTRSSTTSLIDLKETTNIDVSGISFDSNAQITFDGTDDEIIIAGGTGTPLNFTNTDEFTMETWVKIVSMPVSGNTMGIFVKAYKVGIDLYYPTVNTMVFRCGTRNSQQSIVSQTGGYTPLGVWSHVVFTYEPNSSTGVKLYINGVFNNSVSNTSQDDFSNNTNYTIGGNEAIAGTPKFGNISSSVAKMYNKTLSAEEVKQNFNASKKRFGL